MRCLVLPKLVGTVCTEVELEQLRTDLKQMYSWSIDWQTIFNTDKYKVVHFAYKNTAVDYLLGDVNIQSVKEEKDLGIIIHQTPKSSQQCVAAGFGNLRTGNMRTNSANYGRETRVQCEP